jgi:hypothetical protein
MLDSESLGRIRTKSSTRPLAHGEGLPDVDCSTASRHSMPLGRSLLPAGHNPAVDREDDSGDPLRLIRGKEQQGLRGILRLTVAS